MHLCVSVIQRASQTSSRQVFEKEPWLGSGEEGAKETAGKVCNGNNNNNYNNKTVSQGV